MNNYLCDQITRSNQQKEVTMNQNLFYKMHAMSANAARSPKKTFQKMYASLSTANRAIQEKGFRGNYSLHAQSASINNY